MEDITLTEVVQMLESIRKDAERLTSGNIAHQRVHIIAESQFLIDELKTVIKKQKHTKTN